MKAKLLFPLLLLALTAAVYSNSFHCSFHFDDKPHIVENAELRDWHNWREMLKRHPSRELLWLTFLANYQYSQLDPFSWHVVNFILHALNALLLYLFLLRLVPERGKEVALATAALFAVHPLQTESVTYIISRSELLLATFYLTGLLLWLRFRRDYAADGRLARPTYLGVVLCFVAGLSTKESMVTFPVTLALIEFFFPIAASKNRKTPAWSRLAPFGVFIVLGVLWAVERYLESGTVGVSDTDPLVSQLTYLATETRVLVTYLRLHFVPIGLNIDPDYPLSRSFLEPWVVVALLFHGAVAAAALAGRRRYPAEGFFALWFYLLLAPSSSFIPLRDVMAEHRVYLATAGWAFLFVRLAEAAVTALPKARRARTLRAALALAVLLFALLAWQRNRIYLNDLILWSDTATKSPAKSRPHYNLGNAYYNLKRYPEALSHYNRSIELRSNYYAAFFDRGNTFNQQGDKTRAIGDYLETVRLRPEFFQGWYNLGVVQMDLGEDEAAARSFRKALEIRPAFVDAANALGVLETKRGNMTGAIPYFLRVVEADPKHLEALLNLGSAYYGLKDYAKAAVYYRGALASDPKNLKAWLGYAYCLESLGAKNQEVAAVLKRLLEINPAVERSKQFREIAQRVKDRHEAQN